MATRAEDIIALRNQEVADAGTFRTLWQDTADLVFPRQSSITEVPSPGSDKTDEVFDDTAILDSRDMASGLSAALIPTGQKFFGLKMRDPRIDQVEHVRRWLMEVTEVAHEEMYESNFMMQLNETLRSMIVFGTGCLYSEWDSRRMMLNYRDYDVASFVILEDAGGVVDTVILTFRMTPRQAVQKFGESNLSRELIEALDRPSTSAKTFEFIHYVGPRMQRNVLLRDGRNMPVESLFIQVQNKTEIDQGGFQEMPFAVARWTKSSAEKYGRGVGTESLPNVRVLQQMYKDYLDECNMATKPPLSVRERHSSKVVLHPGAINRVIDHDDIRALDTRLHGNPAVTKDMIEVQRSTIHSAFFVDVFRQLADLRGTHRTALEVAERLREGLRRLAQPVARLQSELLTPTINRTIRLLVRNNRVPVIPPEIEGQSFAIEYLGQLSLALREQEATGFMRWMADIAMIAQTNPEAADYPDYDQAIPRLGASYGVNVQDISTTEKVQQKRAARQQAAAAAQLVEGAEQIGKAYKAGATAPEEGSPAGEIMANMGG